MSSINVDMDNHYHQVDIQCDFHEHVGIYLRLQYTQQFREVSNYYYYYARLMASFPRQPG